MTPKKKREPTAIVAALMKEIDDMRRERDLKRGKMMKQAGSTQQAWSRWTLGAEPGVNAVAAIARVLDADLDIHLRDLRTSRVVAPGTTALVGIPAEAVDTADFIKRLLEAYLAAQARDQAIKSK
jgi:hypothetical protein